MRNQFRRGDIYYIANERYRAGSEIRKDRPAIIVSNDVNNKFGNVVEVVFLTTSPKKDIPTHVTIRSTGRKSIALCEQPTAVANERIQNRMGTATKQEMDEIDIALMVALGIDVTKEKTLKVAQMDLKPEDWSGRRKRRRKDKNKRRTYIKTCTKGC